MTTFTTQDREDAERKPMNANELADFVEISKPDDKTHQTIATMLRQQQAEIEALKERNRFLESFYRTVKAQSK
jgi:hypothetical protein